MRFAAVSLACAAFLTPVAVADLITFRFDGVVDSNTFASGPWTFADPGDDFVIGFTFDTDALDSDPDAGRGAFPDSISEFAVIAGTAFQTGGAGVIEVTDNTGGLDAYRVTMPLNGGLFAFIDLTDPSQTALDSDFLPMHLDVDVWEGLTMRVGDGSGGGGQILGTVTAITVIPAPTAGIVCIASLLPRRRRPIT